MNDEDPEWYQLVLDPRYARAFKIAAFFFASFALSSFILAVYLFVVLCLGR